MAFEDHPVIKNLIKTLKSLDSYGIFDKYDSTMILFVAALVVVDALCVLFTILQACSKLQFYI